MSAKARRSASGSASNLSKERDNKSSLPIYQAESDDGEFLHFSGDAESDSDYDIRDSLYEKKNQHIPLSIRNRETRAQHLTTSPQTPHKRMTRRTPPGSGQRTSHRSPAAVEPSFIMPSPDGTPARYRGGASTLRHRKHDHRTAPNYLTPGDQGDENGPWFYVNWLNQNMLLPLLAYMLEVFGYASRHFLKPILGVALGIFIIISILQLGSSLVYSKFSAALAPLCLIPGSSYLIPTCFVPDSDPFANFEDLITVQSHFEDILDSQKDTATLPATLKDSELAIRDLRILVGASRLPSRQQLNLEFDTFVATAKEAATDLSRYNSRIGSAMDRVIATNTWTMNVLRGIEETGSNTGALSNIFTRLTSSFVSAPPTLQQRIFEQYVSHVGKNKEEIESLISTAQALLQVLTNLDERLDTIHAITTNDDSSITRSQDELLSSLWTKLGGNSASVKSNHRHLLLLRNISQYRKQALKHVSETLLRLQEIQAELENLRDGVAAPEVLGWRGGVPIGYYVEVVERGVERLREARGESRRVEGEAIQGRLGRGNEGGVREVDGGPPVVTARLRGS